MLAVRFMGSPSAPLSLFFMGLGVRLYTRLNQPTRGGSPVAPLEQVCASEERRGLQYKASYHPRLLLDSGLATFISANWQFPSQYAVWHGRRQPP
jgi:hypothetical protein